MFRPHWHSGYINVVGNPFLPMYTSVKYSGYGMRQGLVRGICTTDHLDPKRRFSRNDGRFIIFSFAIAK